MSTYKPGYKHAPCRPCYMKTPWKTRQPIAAPPCGQLRKKLGLTQQDVIDRAGVCERTYRDIEHCVTDHGFNTNTLKDVAKVFNISHGTLADMIDSSS